MLLDHQISQPAPNQAEITLIGAGAYGESIVFHPGDDKWVIIDSSINPEYPKTPLALEYLRDINVSTENISLVVCSHWHNDHIKVSLRLSAYC